MEAHPEPPVRLVLDLEVTDLPRHGHQDGRFSYLPLYIFRWGTSVVRAPADGGTGRLAGSTEEVERIVKQIGRAWPLWDNSGKLTGAFAVMS